ncbi:TerB family tellurite resistance protein [Candidatus Pelagibacter sp.]|nr:TerB family tellurite resistance protein [Candidatus Pelagibacter sp.]
MINFFKNKDKDKDKVNDNKSYYNIAALLIHAAKIDENYEEKEKEIIKKTLIELGVESSNIDNLISEAETIEENSNQILDFTREVKSIPISDKIKIIESLWKIIYSNQDADIYETNLMRRLSGLLYIDNRTMGDLKEKIKKELKK